MASNVLILSAAMTKKSLSWTSKLTAARPKARADFASAMLAGLPGSGMWVFDPLIGASAHASTVEVHPSRPYERTWIPNGRSSTA